MPRRSVAVDRRLALGLLLAIALIPLGIAVSKVVAARDLTGGSRHLDGVVTAHDTVAPVGKSASPGWYTSIAVGGEQSVVAESRTLYDAVRDGDPVKVSLSGNGDRVTAVETAAGVRVSVGDDATTAVLGAAVWAALGLAIAAVALLLFSRSG